MTDKTKDLAELEAMIQRDLEEHQKRDSCDCPFLCPNECGTMAHWDMGMEGHICMGYTGPDGNDICYYDGVK